MGNKSTLDTQFVVSYELLQLLQWFSEHEPAALKKLISYALHKGLAEQLEYNESLKKSPPDDLQNNIIDFFSLLETMLQEVLHEEKHLDSDAEEEQDIPAAHQIDTSLCDTQTVATSISQACEALKQDHAGNPKDILCRELLKCWHPTNKIIN